MDNDNRYFQQALSSMVSSAAYGDAVRHMHDRGLTVEEIHKNLDYPVSEEKIRAVIREYERQKATGDSGYEYVEQMDRYGRKSFIRVKR